MGVVCVCELALSCLPQNPLGITVVPENDVVYVFEQRYCYCFLVLFVDWVWHLTEESSIEMDHETQGALDTRAQNNNVSDG